MTPEEAREIDRLEFEADCRAARERAYAILASRQAAKAKPPRLPTDRVIVRRSNAKLYSMDGKSRTLEEWAAMCGQTAATLRYRMSVGMTFEQAVTTRRMKPGVAWAAQPGVGQDLPASEGTGGGSTAQDISEIEFLQ